MQTPSLASITTNSVVNNADQVPVLIKGEGFQLPLTATIGDFRLENVILLDLTTFSAVVNVTEARFRPGSYDLEVHSNGYRMRLPLAFQVTARVEPTQVRVMFVLACDNNLGKDSVCLQIVNQLELAMTRQPDLRIALLWDGIKEDDTAFYHIQPDSRSNQLAHYRKGSTIMLRGELNTGSAAALIEFASWAQGKFPSKYKFLNLFGHGGGWAPMLHPAQPRNFRLQGRAATISAGCSGTIIQRARLRPRRYRRHSHRSHRPTSSM